MVDRKEQNKEAKQSSASSMAAEDNIVVGDVYTDKNSEGLSEVIPYFVDFAGASVNFSGVGRSNEESASTADFLRRFDHVGPVSSRAEDQVSNEDRLKEIKTTRDADAKAEAEDRTAARRKTGV